MKRTNPLKFTALLVTLLLTLTAPLAVFADEGTDAAPPEYTSFSDLKGKNVGLLVGAPFEDMVKSKQPDISVTAEYTEETESAVMKICYNGESFDPTETDDQLPMAVLSAAAQDIRYTWHPEEERGNEVTMTIKP